MNDFSFDSIMFQDDLNSIQENTQFIQQQISTDPISQLNEIMQRLTKIEMTQQQILNHLQLNPIVPVQQQQQNQPAQQIKLWSEEDKEKFIQALIKTKKSNIAYIQQHYLPQKSHKQIISYSQKFFLKLRKSLMAPMKDLDEVKMLTKTAQVFKTLKVTEADNVIQYANSQFQRAYEVVKCPCGMLCRMNDTLQPDLSFVAERAVGLLKTLDVRHSPGELFTMFGNVLINTNYNINFAVKFLSEELAIPRELLFLLLFIYFARHPKKTIMIKENCTCGRGAGHCSCNVKALTAM